MSESPRRDQLDERSRFCCDLGISTIAVLWGIGKPEKDYASLELYYMLFYFVSLFSLDISNFT